MQHWTMSSINKKLPHRGIEPGTFRLQGKSPTTDLWGIDENWRSNCHTYTFFCMNSAIRAASRPHGLTEVTFVDLWPLLLENSGPTAHYFQRNSYLKLFWFFSSQWRKYFLHCEENIFFTVKKNIIFEFFWVFILLFTRKNPENLKKQSVSIIVSFFVKKISSTTVCDLFSPVHSGEENLLLNPLKLGSLANFLLPLEQEKTGHSQ